MAFCINPRNLLFRRITSLIRHPQSLGSVVYLWRKPSTNSDVSTLRMRTIPSWAGLKIANAYVAEGGYTRPRGLIPINRSAIRAYAYTRWLRPAASFAGHVVPKFLAASQLGVQGACHRAPRRQPDRLHKGYFYNFRRWEVTLRRFEESPGTSGTGSPSLLAPTRN